jgi:pilus assembly protein Flp/PilA
MSYIAAVLKTVEGFVKDLFIVFVSDKAGVTAIEYGLVAALIAVVIIGVLSNDGLHLSSTFSKISSSL